MKSLELRRNDILEKTRDLQPDLFHNLFFQTAKKFKDKEYIYSEQKSWTYDEVSTASKKFAASMHKLGVQNKQSVSIIFPNFPELVISKIGISLLGLVAVPLNYRLNAIEFSYLIRQSDSSYIITIDKWKNFDYIASLKEICPEVFEGKISDKFPHLKKIIVFSPEGNKYDGTYDLYNLINAVDESESEEITTMLLASDEVKVEDTSDIMYTSGTTALRKGVLVSHEMMWRAALGSCWSRGYQEGRRIYVPIPLYHCYGYIVGLVGATMVGGCIIFQDDFDEHSAIELIRKSQADDMLCVPTIAIRFTKSI